MAADFGVHAMTPFKWMRRADIDDGTKPARRQTKLQGAGPLRDGCCGAGRASSPAGVIGRRLVG